MKGNEMLLKDKIVLITGAGRGWGQGMAIALAREGAKVIAVSRTASQIEKTVKTVSFEGGAIEGLVTDVRSDEDMKKLFSYIENKYGGLDVLINNAGILPRKHYEDFTFEEIENVIDINLRGEILGCKLAIPIMKKQQNGGSIINVSSVAGVVAKEDESAYCTAKFGVEGFTKSIALETADYNISVNTISPGNLDPNVHLKPTSMSQEEYDALPAEEQKKYTLGIEYCEAVIYLAMQRPKNGGFTGERFICAEFSDHIRKCGYDLKKEDLVWNDYNKGWQ